MPQTSVIDNSNLLRMCLDCGAVGFVPAMTYAYDAAARTVTVTDNSTIPATDAIKRFRAKVHDFFGNDVVGQNTDGTDIVLDVSGLNASKQFALTVMLSTDDGIIADGGAYGLMPAGDVAHWDVEKNAANEL